MFEEENIPVDIPHYRMLKLNSFGHLKGKKHEACVTRKWEASPAFYTGKKYIGPLIL
jgi:hypothetical protein